MTGVKIEGAPITFENNSAFWFFEILVAVYPERFRVGPVAPHPSFIDKLVWPGSLAYL
jgi:hypothetical protein